MEAGQFTNPESNFLAAPQQLNSDGKIRGYVSIVIESVSSFDQTIPTDAQKFAFFRSITQPTDTNGFLSSSVSQGLPAGTYRLSSSVRAANHQPVLAPVSIHGSIDDVVYVCHYFCVFFFKRLTIAVQFAVAQNGSFPNGQTNPSTQTTSLSTVGTFYFSWTCFIVIYGAFSLRQRQPIKLRLLSLAGTNLSP